MGHSYKGNKLQRSGQLSPSRILHNTNILSFSKICCQPKKTSDLEYFADKKSTKLIFVAFKSIS